MKLYLVRHAQSKRNVGEESSVDAELTKTGKEQAKRLGLYFKKIKVDVIFCSPLIRTRETLKEALPYLDSVPIKYTLEIAEHKMGIYGEGGKDDNSEYKKAAEKAKINFFQFKPKGGESFTETYKRAGRFFKKLLKLYGRTDKKILIVSHGTLGKHLILNALKLDIEESSYFGLNNASISILDFDKNGKVVKYDLNDTHHIIDYALKKDSKI